MKPSDFSTSLWQGTVFQWAAIDGCLLEANYGRRRYLANRPGTDERTLTRWLSRRAGPVALTSNDSAYLPKYKHTHTQETRRGG